MNNAAVWITLLWKMVSSGLVDAINHFNLVFISILETIGLNEVAIATSQQQEGNHAAEADIHTQFYQVDQVLNFKCSVRFHLKMCKEIFRSLLS